MLIFLLLFCCWYFTLYLRSVGDQSCIFLIFWIDNKYLRMFYKRLFLIFGVVCSKDQLLCEQIWKKWPFLEVPYIIFFLELDHTSKKSRILWWFQKRKYAFIIMTLKPKYKDFFMRKFSQALIFNTFLLLHLFWDVFSLSHIYIFKISIELSI